MPFYSDEIIEEVRSRSDIVKVIGARVKLTRKGANYFGCCPFHSEKTPSFCVSPSRQTYHCFGCGAGGNVLHFVMNYESVSFPEAMNQLAGEAGIKLPARPMNEGEKKREGEKNKLQAVNHEAAVFFYHLLRRPEGREGMAYFKRRGLSEETMQRFGLGFAPRSFDGIYQYLKQKGFSDEELRASTLVKFSESRGPRDYFYNRVMFPIMDNAKRVIGFGGRVLGEGEPKYLNSPETPLFEKSRNLYGLHLARASRRPYFLLCEGYMDVIALHQAGFDCAVASLGTALTQNHARLLRRYHRSAVLCYDSDGAGLKAAMRAIPLLRAEGVPCRVLNMSPYKDPDEFIVHEGAEAFEKRIEEAENDFLFQSDEWKKSFDPDNPAERTAYQRRVAEELTVFTEEIERENYLKAVCERHGIPEGPLRSLVNSLGNRRYTAEPDIPGMQDMALKARGDSREAKGMLDAAQIVLGFLALGKASEENMKRWVREEDMPGELFRELYRGIMKEKEEKGTVQPAVLMNAYLEDEEKSRQLAAIFTHPLLEEDDPEEKRQIIRENIFRLRQNALKEELRSCTDPARSAAIIDELGKKTRPDIGPGDI